MANRVGIRFITVDALYDPDTGYDITGYYKRFGFELVNIENAEPCGNFRTMYFDIKAVVEQAKTLRLSV